MRRRDATGRRTRRSRGRRDSSGHGRRCHRTRPVRVRNSVSSDDVGSGEARLTWTPRTPSSSLTSPLASHLALILTFCFRSCTRDDLGLFFDLLKKGHFAQSAASSDATLKTTHKRDGRTWLSMQRRLISVHRSRNLTKGCRRTRRRSPGPLHRKVRLLARDRNPGRRARRRG